VKESSLRPETFRCRPSPAASLATSPFRDLQGEVSSKKKKKKKKKKECAQPCVS
jgi:hypothetical protein